MASSWLSTVQKEISRMSIIPRVTAGVGGVFVLLAIAQAIFTFRAGGNLLALTIDFLLLSLPGVAFVYTGFQMPSSDLERQYYPRMIAWTLGGIAVMFGFIVLRDLHPGVTVEWSFGTQAIALTIGSIGGLLIGIQETRATMQTEQLEQKTRQLEEYTDQLEQREQKLKRRNEQLDNFAGVVSHDIRNPLTIAQGRLELLQEDCDSEHIPPIETALTRIDTLIEDLLTLARQGEQVSETEAINLKGLCEACWRTVETADATIQVSIDRTVQADRSRLAQLLENLIRNAIEHGYGDMKITIGELEDGFYVEDNGPGISEDERDDVFEMGYSTSEGGTGFGLSIVKQVADAHGWDICVTDGTEGGARFEITGFEFAAE